MRRSSISVTIRNVPGDVHHDLSARASAQGQSLQEFLRHELERIAMRPSLDELMRQVRSRKARTGQKLSTKRIIEYRDADRR